MCWIKALTITTLLFTLSFVGCKTTKQKEEPKYEDSFIKITSKKNGVPTSYITGNVKSLNDGQPIAFAIVTLYSKTKQLSTQTDEQGNFTIKDIAIDSYRLTIRAVDYDNEDIAFGMEEHTIFVVEARLKEIRLHTEKPVIYIYPTQQQHVNVHLNYAGNLTHTYPKYPEKGWNVIAEPNGTLWDEDGMEYYALFWEGTPHKPLTAKDGFVVAGEGTAKFLEEKLAYLGLNRREANEFMMYWLPRMENNAYNLIHFSGEDYESLAELKITPQPETFIRVMMLTRPLTNKIDVPLQDLKPLHKTRKGFTVVEWGGSVIHHSDIQ